MVSREATTGFFTRQSPISKGLIGGWHQWCIFTRQWFEFVGGTNRAPRTNRAPFVGGTNRAPFVGGTNRGTTRELRYQLPRQSRSDGRR